MLTGGALRAVVLNSGGANACTGPEGFQTTHATAEKAAEVLAAARSRSRSAPPASSASSCPAPPLLAGVEKAAAELAATAEAGTAAATAVLTTDTTPSRRHVAAAGFSVGGFAKGAGMIAPRWPRCWSVLTTDAVADAATCDAALRAAVGVTFDRLDVDGGTSTNDTVLLLASGASGVRPGAGGAHRRRHTPPARDLCLQLQADAEGVTKHVTIAVTRRPHRGRRGRRRPHGGAGQPLQDRLLRRRPQLGPHRDGRRPRRRRGRRRPARHHDQRRRRCAATGWPAGDRHAADLSGSDITVEIELGLGDGAAEILTTDLSHAYVEENSAYSS